VIRYLKGTLDYGLIYASNGEIRLQRFIDSDWEGSAGDRRSLQDVVLVWDQE